MSITFFRALCKIKIIGKFCTKIYVAVVCISYYFEKKERYVE